MTFADLGLSEDILKAVTDAGYDTPTPIQRQAIPSIMMARDILGCAQTGTGKTASFVLPMLDILHHGRARMRMPRSIILEPTRELATQVAKNFDTYGKYVPLSKALVIGGESFVEQQKILEKGADVIIATPGRLIDTFERGKLLLSDCKLLVIDEADRMLDMGFIPDIEKIVNMLPKQRQTLFFSATMPKEIRRLADKFLNNPKEITVSAPSSMATTLEHKLVVIDEMDKRETLRRLIRNEDIKNAFVFCNRKKDVDILYKSLTKHGFNAGRMHGDLVQSERTETLDKFKSGDITVLICSDVAARGIDVADVSHVFNFDVPFNAEDYVHRTGRTGRAGRAGKAFTLATPEDGKLVEAINKTINMTIPITSVEGIEILELDFSGKKRRNKRNNRAKDGERSERGRTSNAPRNGDDNNNRRNASRRPGPQDQKNAAPAAPREAAKPAERPVAQAAPAAAPASNVQQAAPSSPAPSRHVRDPREDRHQSRPQRDRKNNNRRDRDDHDDKPVIGMGDHVPAFLLTAVPLSSLRKPAKLEQDEEETKPVKKTARKPSTRKTGSSRNNRRPARNDANKGTETENADKSANAVESTQVENAPASAAPAVTPAIDAAPAPAAPAPAEPAAAAPAHTPENAIPASSTAVETSANTPAATAPDAETDGEKAAKAPAKPKAARAPRKPRARAAAKPKATAKTADAGADGETAVGGDDGEKVKAAPKKAAKPRAPRKPRKKPAASTENAPTSEGTASTSADSNSENAG
tara:strand:+ start:13692 stop:15959 length:2268 start_codon:yes stop_codon:yes gene_type:complete